MSPTTRCRCHAATPKHTGPSSDELYPLKWRTKTEPLVVCVNFFDHNMLGQSCELAVVTGDMGALRITLGGPTAEKYNVLMRQRSAA